MDWVLTDLIKDLKDLKKNYNTGTTLKEDEINVILSLADKIREMKKNEVSTWSDSFRKAFIVSLPQIIWYTTLFETQ